MPALKTLEEKGCYQFESFAGFPIVAAFSDKTFDMRFAEDILPLNVNDRAVFCDRMNISLNDLVCLEQIHSSNIVLVNTGMKGRGCTRREDAVSRADGAITKEKNVPIGIQTADCASLFFYGAKKQTAGIAHVGWRGLYGGLAEKMVAAFTNNFLCSPKDLHVGVGPMIRKCCYEVGPDVAASFDGFIVRKKEKMHLDLAGAIITRLRAAGVPKSHIEDSGFCTCCQPDLFHSHRREAQSAGRMLSVIMLR